MVECEWVAEWTCGVLFTEACDGTGGGPEGISEVAGTTVMCDEMMEERVRV